MRAIEHVFQGAAVTGAVIAAAGSVDLTTIVTIVAAPCLLAWLNNRSQVKSRESEWKRADEVAEADRKRQTEKENKEKKERDKVAADLLASQVEIAETQRTTAAEVAGKVEEVAQAQVEATAKVAQVAEAVTVTDAKLDEVGTNGKKILKHVNSAYTALSRRELAGLKRQLVLMIEAVELNKALKREPSAEVSENIEAMRADILALEDEIKKQIEATKAADRIDSGIQSVEVVNQEPVQVDVVEKKGG